MADYFFDLFLAKEIPFVTALGFEPRSKVLFMLYKYKDKCL
jgi:hypothetical protein